MSASRQLPKYRSHKEVWALKIKAIEPDGSAPPGAAGSCLMTPEEDGYAPIRLDEAYVRKHNPQAGGYYVVYPDGYTSWSPAQSFEEGYTLIGGK